ncbi:hypothetical protein [Chitinophaga japonensis]|uniref:Uncharacterized protein n=1 Tax=Chitinophaga japonensis TaxID=104662 RepID=A0A562T6R8_CHIJA|nr:hypothetical protein [Chitinophaga japonensis]TWI89241.1 hypothetical protein LX66_3335 [Chitinophaga japonensis]
MSYLSKNTDAERAYFPAAVYQRSASGISRPAVVQRFGIEDFDTYQEAKDANIYSKALLDTQKDDRIEEHFQKKFDSDQQRAIYKVNKKHYGQGSIVSDGDGATLLVKQNTDLVPHIDHRFPKSRGGSNSYINAAVLPAKGNIKKSNKLELSAEPASALEPYKFLAFSSAFGPGKVGAFRDFTAEQRAEILSANQMHYDKGSPVSDVDGKTKLARFDTSRIPHIDHITAKGEGGTNFYFNAAVLPASDNMKKSGRKGREFDINHAIGKLTLERYYKKKEEGTLPPGGVIEDDRSASGSDSD